MYLLLKAFSVMVKYFKKFFLLKHTIIETLHINGFI